MLKAFDYLDSIRVMKLRIQIKTRQAQQLRDTVSNITASMDEEHVSHTKNTSAMADAMVMILDLEEEISEMRNKLCKRRREILTILDRIKPEYAIVLSGYFIEGKSTKDLAIALYLSKRQVQRRLSNGLAEFQIILTNLTEHGDASWTGAK